MNNDPPFDIRVSARQPTRVQTHLGQNNIKYKQMLFLDRQPRQNRGKIVTLGVMKMYRELEFSIPILFICALNGIK
jgi:hypothetical protein